MDSQDQIRKAIQAALLALTASETASAAARETLSAVSVALEKKTRDGTEWLDVDQVTQRLPVSRRTVLAAFRKKKLRGTKPAGSRVVLFTLDAVEDWIHARTDRALRVAR